MGNNGGKSKSQVGPNSAYDYDVLIVGGGVAGLSVAKSLASQSTKKIGLVNWVKPTPHGVSWDLGGTSTNVGCIPNKLLHHACVNADFAKDCSSYGWKVDGNAPFTFDWQTMNNNIQNYMKTLSDSHRSILEENKIEEITAFVELVNPKNVKLHYECDADGYPNKIDPVKIPCLVSVQNVVLAIGSRPKYLEIPGGRFEDEICITSDDIFSLSHTPGKVLIIGAGYVGVECATLLSRLGCDCTMLIRSDLLRGFDKDVVKKIRDMLMNKGVKFQVGYLPLEIYKGDPNAKEVSKRKSKKSTTTTALTSSSNKMITVVLQNQVNNETAKMEYNTVILAIGRYTNTDGMGLENLGIDTDKETGQIINDETNQATSKQPFVYAVGDCAYGKPQNSSFIRKNAFYLGRRILELEKFVTEYNLLPRTLYAPFEYGFIGMSEEAAIKKYGKSNVECYLRSTIPLECVLPGRTSEFVYAKLVTRKSMFKEKIVGFHYMGPYAGEITCAFSLVMNYGPTKSTFDDAIGIHPTCAEIFTDMKITKSSGLSTEKTGC